MLQEGSSRKSILSELKKMHALDQRYDDGRILCSMCTKPHPIAVKAYQMFRESNLGDPGLYQGSSMLEKEVISQLATLLHGKTSVGFIVSGGTEANLLSLLAARNSLNIEQPEVIVPQSAHFSFVKICNMLNLKPVYVQLNGAYKVDISEVEKYINERTIAIVGTAGTAEIGVIDPIDELSKISLRHKVWLHVDAAFGGLLIPFLNTIKPQFDFTLDAINSITVDPHKMGMAPIPAGGILFREAKMLNALKVETPYLTEKSQYTFTGTRTGASAAAAWAVFKLLGIEGFQKIVKSCITSTKLLASGLKKIGYKLVTEPPLNIIAFRSENTKQLADQLQKQGWFVSYIPRYDCIRIALMPHVKKAHVKAFLKCLSEQ